jgi:hypothetical protein
MPSLSVKRLQNLFRQLTEKDQESLLSFAEFLQARASSQAVTLVRSLPVPKTIPRPSEESIIAAIKRLSQCYYMLDKSKMLHETADLVTQHCLQGQELQGVIDRLEQVFSQHYDNFVRDFNLP